MFLFLLQVIGLVLGFLGSVFLLKEPVRLRLRDGHVEVDTDMKSYTNRLHIRRVGIVMLAIGFILQIIAI